MLGEERIMRSSIADDIFEKAFRQGFEQGFKQGYELGIQRGMRTLFAIAEKLVSGEELRELKEIDDFFELSDRIIQLVTPPNR
jgi:flagellar biosynthesis/type III secretory pathway protein FliH